MKPIYGWNKNSNVYHIVKEGKRGWHDHAGGERWIDSWATEPPFGLGECRCVAESLIVHFGVAPINVECLTCFRIISNNNKSGVCQRCRIKRRQVRTRASQMTRRMAG